MDSIKGNPADILAFLQKFRPLECNDCNRIIAFQNKVTEKLLCAQAALPHEVGCYSRAYQKEISGAAEYFKKQKEVEEFNVSSASSRIEEQTLKGQVISGDAKPNANLGLHPVIRRKNSADQTGHKLAPARQVVDVPAPPLPATVEVSAPEVSVDNVDSGPSQPQLPVVVKIPVVPVSEPLPKKDEVKVAPKPSEDSKVYMVTDCSYSRNLRQGANVTVCFSWNPTTHLVTAEEDAAKIEKFQNEVVTPFLNTANRMASPPVVGQMVIAPYDSEFYRGKVTKVKGEKCQVEFVDFGDKSKCKYKDIYSIDSSIMSIPIYGMTIRLKGMPDAIKDASEEKAAKMEKVTSVGFFKLDLTNLENPTPLSEPHEARLSNSQSESLAEMICNIYGVDAKPVAPVEKRTMAPPVTVSRPYSWKNCIYSKSLDHHARVSICFQYSPTVYHIAAEKDEERLNFLQTVVFNHAQKCIENNIRVKDAQIDDIVIGTYEEEYYRARIEEVNGEECTISFVDYGDTRKCKISDLLPINDIILKTPIYGMKIHMDKTMPCKELVFPKDLKALLADTLILDLAIHTSPVTPGENPIVEVTLRDKNLLRSVNSLVAQAIVAAR